MLTPKAEAENVLRRVGYPADAIVDVLGQLSDPLISARTVEHDLRKVFIKLGIGSRKELRRARASDPPAASTGSVL